MASQFLIVSDRVPRGGVKSGMARIKRHSALLLLILSLSFARAASAPNSPDWTEPFPPHHIAGNIYYVGTHGLASFLISTPEGHILINSDLESTVPIIRDNVAKLGFHFSDVKILLISHAHFDHAAGSALIKKMTGAKYMVMDAERGDRGQSQRESRIQAGEECAVSANRAGLRDHVHSAEVFSL